MLDRTRSFATSIARSGQAASVVGAIRGRLYRKFATLLVALVASALLVVTGFEAYNSYFEHRAALAAVQREKAQGAAAVIEQFLREIEGQLGWTTHAGVLASAGGSDQRRLDFLRLLRQAPAITEIAHVDAEGREQLRVSRLAMDVVGSGLDRSGEEAVKQALAERRHVSEVYFRKGSEPYLTLAITGVSRRAGVTIAEVNLKFIWDVISRIKAGRAGIAYAVDDRGLLIAHPDIGLVLRKTDMSMLEQVRLSAGAAENAVAVPEIATDRTGRKVLTAHAAVEPVGWRVFVEQPLEEAFAPLYASLWRTGLLSMVGIVIAGLLGLWLAQRMAVPIEALSQGAARIGAGDLGHRIAVRTGDEVEALADRFNEMGARLEESYAGLERKVDERTRDLNEALEYQTATADVLGVISRSPNELQPVLDAIVATAGRLCGAERANIMLRRPDGAFHLAASFNADPTMVEFMRANPTRAGRDSLTGRVALDGRTIHIVDAQADPEFAYQPQGGAEPRRTMLGVPLTRSGELIGTIVLTQTVVRPFTDRQINLVTTFADQAVIAINNVGLFEEVQTRTRELARALAETEALGKVGQTVSSSLDLKEVLATVLSNACALAQAGGGTIYVLDDNNETLSLAASHNMSENVVDALCECVMRLSDSPSARSIVSGRSEQIADLGEQAGNAVFDVLSGIGIRALLGVPLRHQNRTTGILFIGRNTPGAFSAETVALLEAFASQSAIALNNARLFRELETKSEQLRIASLHKSQFLANMSHELRTPLNAILGYSELIQDGVYCEVAPKLASVLERVQSNGRHLLGLINDVLDLSKIEAGQFVLRLEPYSMRDVVMTVIGATEALAADKKLALSTDIAPDLANGTGDAQRITQVLLNLVGNALKFTDAGSVTVTVRQKGAKYVIKVADTGPGIPAAEQANIFEEFHQVDSSNTKKKGGTGLGLAISRRIVALHGGRISVESTPGEGSVFRVDLPVRVENQRGL